MSQILFRSLLLASFLLIVYLIHLIETSEATLALRLDTIQQNVAQHKALLESQKNLLENLQKKWEDQEKARKEKIEQERQQALQEQRLQGLRGALAGVEEAEAWKQRGDLAAAAQRLLATKEAIWKAGDTFPAQKENLHGLMPLIDGLANQWKSGAKNVGVGPIRERLQNALKALGK